MGKAVAAIVGIYAVYFAVLAGFIWLIANIVKGVFF